VAFVRFSPLARAARRLGIRARDDAAATRVIVDGAPLRDATRESDERRGRRGHGVRMRSRAARRLGRATPPSMVSRREVARFEANGF
jgi:hypothetical protein